jgi:hypothetical protein
MKKQMLFIAFFLLLLVGCVGQKELAVEGESKNWKAEIVYPVSESVQLGKGFITYLGTEDLRKLEYEINFPKIFSVGASGGRDNENHNNTVFDLGGLNPPHDDVDVVRDNIEKITITVEWETVSGNMNEEDIELTSKE